MNDPLSDLRPTVSFKAVLLSIGGLWLTYFALATMRWEAMDFGYSLEMLQLRCIVVAAGVVVTLGLWLLLRLFDRRSMWVKAVAALIISMPVAVVLAQINNYVFADMNAMFDRQFQEQYVERDKVEQGDTEARERHPSEKELRPSSREGDLLDENDTYKAEQDLGVLGFLGSLAELAFSRYFMLLAWCSLYFSLVAVAQVRVAERREQMFRSAAKAAELRSLRYQVNPHFLFNTLNSLSALVMTGKAERAEQMIHTISRFYRHSLADEPTSDVRLEEEFDLQQLYLEIEAVRFPDRLRCEFDLPDDLRDARVPGMILQPLVENSVKYAVSPVNRPVTISVIAREEFDRLVITVADDGPGQPEGAENGFGIGLANVRDRLEARFGPDVGFTSGPVPDGYRSEIRIPLTRNG